MLIWPKLNFPAVYSVSLNAHMTQPSTQQIAVLPDVSDKWETEHFLFRRLQHAPKRTVKNEVILTTERKFGVLLIWWLVTAKQPFFIGCVSMYDVSFCWQFQEVWKGNLCAKQFTFLDYIYVWLWSVYHKTFIINPYVYFTTKNMQSHRK